MSAKNIKMISLVVVLLIANAFLFLSKPSYSSIDYDPAMLAVSDTSAIDKISLSYKGTDHVFARSTNWRMSEKFAFDFNLRQILFLVTQRVRVSRKVVGEEASAVLAYAASGGADVIIESGGDELTYRVVGNPTQTKTFFVSEGEVYEMEIPGYRDYIGGIYQLTPDQWKDRLVFDGNWRTIQQVIIDH